MIVENIFPRFCLFCPVLNASWHSDLAMCCFWNKVLNTDLPIACTHPVTKEINWKESCQTIVRTGLKLCSILE